ncbi:MAG: hypothetical protein LLH30_16570 [Candidatus Manganitrophus sp. SA1]|nr:hypothetical protein [Candidatus Manganitrophus morganii]
MFEEILEYGIPIMIAAAFVSFIWAFILTAVKSPEPLEENPIQSKTDPNRVYPMPALKESELAFCERSESHEIEPQTTAV